MAGRGTFHPISAVAIIFLLYCLRDVLPCCASTIQDDANATGSCIESERRALLAIKGDIGNSTVLLSSWRGRDCCRWKGVGCNNITGHVITLDLRCMPSDGCNYPQLSKVNPSLSQLMHLEYLDLSFNNFSGAPIPEFIWSLIHLSHLDLSYAGFDGMVSHQLGNLSSLRYLDLRWNKLSGDDLRWLFQLWSLQYLDLGGNDLSGSDFRWLSQLHSLVVLRLSEASLSDSQIVTLSHAINFTTLTTLDLSGNYNLSSTVPLWIFNISSLTELSLRDCNFSGGLPMEIGNLYSLQLLDLSNNSISGGLPRDMGKLCKLQSLHMPDNSIEGEITNLIDDLSKCSENRPSNRSSDYSGLSWLILGNNKLNGTIPKSLGQLSQLWCLDLSHNSFVGDLTEVHFAQVVRLSSLDLSYNDLRMNVSEDWVLPSQLSSIRMCSCPLGPKFPSWLRNQTVLFELCITEAGISENFPDWFWDSSSITMLNLNASHNNMKGHLPTSVTNVNSIFDVSFNCFEGAIPMFDSSWMYIMDFSNNSFSGPIRLSYATSYEFLQVLSLSHNYINGTIPDWFCNLTSISVLRLSNNDLSGQFPHCWHSSSQLVLLDLSHNKFYGQIPSSMGNLTLLQSLHMRNNGLSGEIPSSLKNLTRLVTLDLAENNLSGTVPEWIGGNFSSLRVLSLRSNLFHGNIPLQISHLASLQVLDLAHNYLSGILSPSLGNLIAMAVVQKVEEPLLHTRIVFDNYFSESLLITVKDLPLEYTDLLSLVTSIDLSGNILNGEIPEELTRLSGLHFLNLSDNHFVGKIPENISQMLQLESLDLSINNLSGTIPNGIARLNFLSCLNLSYNNLSGRIPSGSQLQTFQPSTYSGNPNLCGPPLPNNCTDSSLQPRHQKVEGNEDQSDILWVYLGLIHGFVVGFWLFIGAMMIKRTRRIAYLRLIDQMCDCLYVKIAVNFAKMKSVIVKHKKQQG